VGRTASHLLELAWLKNRSRRNHMGGRGWLIFQVVTDRVLTHRGFTALDVLAIGLITVSIFETVLGAPRTYVFAHTTNRIDVELGAAVQAPDCAGGGSTWRGSRFIQPSAQAESIVPHSGGRNVS
jgi:hypothetical protein